MNLRKSFPIYINTLNIFRPLYTWRKNDHIKQLPIIKFKCKIANFDWLKNYIYTWYWWDHPYIWNFKKKWIIILIDDVQYKNTYGMQELESVPFIIIKIFNLNLIWKFKSPTGNDYEYWET